MRIRYKFILYLLSLALVWWGMYCKLDAGVGLTCLAMMFVSGQWCTYGIYVELWARFYCCLCAFFWTGMICLFDDGDYTFGNWFASGLLCSFFLNFFASARSWYEPGCVPMDRDGC